MLSYTEENYIKSIYHLGRHNASQETSTNSIAEFLTIKPATVTSMLKRLREKKLIEYQRYGKVTLTPEGIKQALQIIRKHRLWEVFLVDKLQFTWDEVHEVAEQLEHIQSEKLIDKLDAFLAFPTHDPHGDPIPDTSGMFQVVSQTSLAEAGVGTSCHVVAVKDSSNDFLQYLMQLQITLQTQIKVLQRYDFDRSLQIAIGQRILTVSEQVAQNILIR